MTRIFNGLFLRNLLLWLFIEVLILFSLIQAGSQSSLSHFLFPLAAMTGFYLAIFCFNHYAVRLLLFKKKLALFGLSLLVYLFLLSLALWFVLHGFKPGEWVASFINALLLQLIGSGFYFIYLWVRDNIIRTGEQLRQKQDELHLLHLQMNPHFLMNALNNLYGVSLSAPELVPDKILELSDLLRFQVNATRRERVLLDEEIEFLRQFISHQHWKSRQLKAGMQVHGSTGKIEIPPLLSLPLLENAIKFALETPLPSVELRIDYSGGILTFETGNTCLPLPQRKTGTGLGLANLQKRLELSGITHQLSHRETEAGMYYATLKLWISQ
ncbi:MAG: histidine kinase [Bacteroidia bacterium]|jgi:hypothetical protein|nr:histidine kinase [Bacteroidia bacterium]